MRNGNGKWSCASNHWYLCSYPTYEEWKHSTRKPRFIFINCSYPTYEEWKPKTKDEIKTILSRSYPTYEEWKQFLSNSFVIARSSSYPTYEEWKLEEEMITINAAIKFLSYL